MAKWFYRLSGVDSEKLLLERGTNGSFLVRPSYSPPGSFRFSVRRGNEVTHIKIQNTDGFLDLYGGEKFATLPELVAYYMQDGKELKERNGQIIELKYPLLRVDPTAERWFHGDINGKEAEKMLLEKGRNGSFLVRESMRTIGSYVVSVLTGDHVDHVMIYCRDNKKFDIGGGCQFDNLKDLIDFYATTPMLEKSGTLVSLIHPFNATRVNVLSIKERMTQLEKNSDRGPNVQPGFLEEFDELQQDARSKNLTRDEGFKTYNADKNRCRNILPFDNNRVKLVDGDPNDPGSDFINANHINWPFPRTTSIIVPGTIYHNTKSKINSISANFSDGNDNALLHLSARCVQPDKCQQLINAGAVIDPINKAGNTPLLELLSNVEYQNTHDNINKVIEIVQILVESGSDIHKTTMTGMTVFQCASMFRNERLMLALVTHQTKISNVTKDDFKLIFAEKWHTYAEVLISRLDKRSLLSYITSDIIHLAMAEATSNLVKLLFESTNIQVQQSVLEDILFMSVSNNDDGLFDGLINENISVPKLYENGENLLSSLLKSSKTKYCRKLLQSINGKRFVNLRNARGQMPLQVAIEMKLFDIVDNLIFKTNVINNEDNDGNTAMTQLFTQISNNDDEIVESRLVGLIKFIICQGGDIYKVNSMNSQVISFCTNPSVRSDVEDFFNDQQNHVSGPVTERVIEVEKMICTICTVREVDCALQCGHTFCMQCGQEFVRCPICNSDSTTFKRIFLG